MSAEAATLPSRVQRGFLSRIGAYWDRRRRSY